MELTTLVYENDKGIFCDSLMIAEKFEKRHADVLRDIDNLLKSLKVSLSNFAVRNSELLFIESDYLNRGKTYKKYEMNRHAFSLLVMGFTGSKALHWQIKFNNAFYQMETKIKELAPKLPQTKLEWIEFSLIQEKENIQLQIENKQKDEKIENDKPKVDYMEHVFFKADDNKNILDDKKEALTVGATANIFYDEYKYKIGQNYLFKFIRFLEHFQKNNYNRPYQIYLDKGFYLVQENYIESKGKFIPQPLITKKGRVYLFKQLKLFIEEYGLKEFKEIIKNT